MLQCESKQAPNCRRITILEKTRSRNSRRSNQFDTQPYRSPSQSYRTFDKMASYHLDRSAERRACLEAKG
jgi:hypothetical protein